ncbi:MAG: histone deacetylase family protein [Candidatus Thiodiazotropha lotti]|uniref:Deacetylase n=1 Tax=Candidatus Thiodiazotropha endoloripes TaxID=1818881 RepID=A0A1E2UQ44_9GAMM|nr:histone deacetylase family protein [Candidatus Thiodiazotropha endoloripes]MCG7897605.1 histone deacetylase family protein [Candidatus Thiodiazotropha weberae]MCG7992463.1 histone deacetylase family protein [Candidatus Thiodiazotropha lotti]MCG8001482.1 histone deacetylase family protein [Candidatus Thiodiazotropha lotti]MCW4184121.1 histone deacetylase family protein [Candidatus Thiodiazotropha weberae]MCW4193256.1 histone deacetylase family protein [Candidatus Thiodiazotropha weberae]
MRTAYITHPDCLNHDTGVGHPENASRLQAIDDRLMAAQLYDFLRHYDAPEVTREQLLRCHDEAYLNQVEKLMPESGHAHLDPDTVVSPQSLQAAKRAAGAVIKGVDLIMQEGLKNAFCAVRPPGHHAERMKTMGFCVYGNASVGAAHAMAEYGLERVAILDFDVHHGNGSEDIFRDDRRVIVCSTFQHPFYPYTAIEESPDHIICAPLEATAKSAEFKAAVTDHWLPALNHFEPQMIFVSAGFDAHVEDDMSGVSLTEADYRWVTEQILQIADQYAEGRVVSVLEGGYEPHALARSVEAHIRVLMDLH